MTRRSLILLLVATLALAGCTAGPGTPTSTADGQPAEGAATGAPPGVDDGRLANASALLEAHESALAETGFAATVTRSVNGSRASRYRVVAAADLATYRLSGSNARPDGSSVETRLWANETTRFVRYESGGETRYRTATRQDDSVNLLYSVGEYLRAGNFTVANGTATDGRTVLVADGYEPLVEGRGPFDGVESFAARAVVDADGRIHALNASVERAAGSETYNFTLDRTGVASVDRPDWVSGIPESATLSPKLSVDVRESRVLAVRNEGGDAVPAGATLSLTTDGTTYAATLDEPLEPGEVRYAAISADDGSFGLTAERPAATDVVELSSPVEVRIETADGVSLYSAGMAWGSGSATESGGESGSGSSGGGASSSGGSGAGGSASGGSSGSDEATATSASSG